MSLFFTPKNHLFQSPGLLDVLPAAIDFFEGSPVYSLASLESFVGSGVYGLYYKGAFSAYMPLTTSNSATFNTPIYIGMTKPPGGRTGKINPNSQSKSLFGRLCEHADSIRKAQSYAENLSETEHIRIEDFYCRFMIIPDEFWPLTGAFETGLIIKHLPLWNSSMSGFGIHNPGVGRGEQKVSVWDSLHPGRKLANANSTRHEREVIFANIKGHFTRRGLLSDGLFSK